MLKLRPLESKKAESGVANIWDFCFCHPLWLQHTGKHTADYHGVNVLVSAASAHTACTAHSSQENQAAAICPDKCKPGSSLYTVGTWDHTQCILAEINITLAFQMWIKMIGKKYNSLHPSHVVGFLKLVKYIFCNPYLKKH